METPLAVTSDRRKPPMKSMTARTILPFALMVLTSDCFAQDPTPRPPATPLPGDANNDGFVDEEDLLLFHENWHTGTNLQADLVAIGLPGLRGGAQQIGLVRIKPAGHSFQMGSTETERGRTPDEGPVHTVTFRYDFYMGETEITQAQWKALMGTNPASDLGLDPKGVGDNYPVYYVSWNDIAGHDGFLDRLNELGHGAFRLPSEAEWEYACRAGSTTRFSFGNSLGCNDECQNCNAAKGVIFIEKRADYMWYCGNNNPEGS